MEKEKPFFSKDEPFFDKHVRDNLKYLSEALQPDVKAEEPEKTKQEIIQKSSRVGYFCPLVEAGERVRRGQKIGFIRIKGLAKEEMIEAEADGVIKEILPEAETGFAAGETKEQYEITDAAGNKQLKERTLTSVEYGQGLFTLEPETEKSSSK